MQNMMKNLMGDMNAMNWMEDMNPTKIGIQMLNFQKSAFNNTYNSMLLIQQQTEAMTESLLKNIPGISEEWNIIVKNNQENVKKAVDEGFLKAESYLSAVSSPAKEAKPAAAETAKEKAAPQAK
jgi:hypothetical protein